MNTEKIRLAEEFARMCHEGQFRKGAAQEPYAVHLEEVAELVRSYGGNETERPSSHDGQPCRHRSSRKSKSHIHSAHREYYPFISPTMFVID